ncbi:hypothetical protein HJC23_002082 [Cyclotella cryptica]|uniref:Geranylgeranyl diphosphate synthase n=1 Tax=Cyclotella cryptica TaxID=29204 RepID=A0ABD3P6N6_9STRA|eukprot:CCRYP_017108-RA/>CCRYP_017108-RA protein AED:0.02 eAED:0.02 QI:160/1/1/1/0/0/2/1530/372
MTDQHQPHQPPPHLLEPYHYISSTPGKNIRSSLIDCFQLWLNVPRLHNPTSSSSSSNPDHKSNNDQNNDSNRHEIDILSEIKSITALLHNASLLIDDIEDNSKLRRGNPVAHSIFGVPNVINCANYVYFLALGRVQALGKEEAMQVFVNEMLNLHRGQGHDIHWRDSTTCPTESQYISMVIDKTGGLFRLAVGLMQAFATTSTDVDFTPLVNNLGLYFQIRDDLINLADEEYMKSKSFCEDLTEGKFSFPIIHCIRHGGGDGSVANQLLSILKQRTEDVDVKRYAQRLMFEAGSLHYTREKCTRLKEEIVQQIVDLGGNDPLLKMIEMLDVQVEKIAELHGCERGGEGGGYETRGVGTPKRGDDPSLNLDYT